MTATKGLCRNRNIKQSLPEDNCQRKRKLHQDPRKVLPIPALRVWLFVFPSTNICTIAPEMVRVLVSEEDGRCDNTRSEHNINYNGKHAGHNGDLVEEGDDNGDTSENNRSEHLFCISDHRSLIMYSSLYAPMLRGLWSSISSDKGRSYATERDRG